jgi:hypothetical protein
MDQYKKINLHNNCTVANIVTFTEMCSVMFKHTNRLKKAMTRNGLEQQDIHSEFHESESTGLKMWNMQLHVCTCTYTIIITAITLLCLHNMKFFLHY